MYSGRLCLRVNRIFAMLIAVSRYIYLRPAMSVENDEILLALAKDQRISMLRREQVATVADRAILRRVRLRSINAQVFHGSGPGIRGIPGCGDRRR